ncbi:hypothetical protein [Okeania sp. SIO2B3]|nr:hypothetical protein [Okeania sp. SIO2B3]
MERFDDGKNRYVFKLHKMTIFLVFILGKMPEYLIVSQSGNLVE